MPGNGTRNLTQSRVNTDVADATYPAFLEARTNTPRRIALKNLALGITLFFDLVASISLGRESSPGADMPHIDLEPYNAYQLGVSRRHAILKLEEGRVCLIDNNSVNGIWLNREMLRPNVSYPLLHGDTMRLGGLTLQIGFPSDPFVVLSRRNGV
jgi:pSer/pThr/pTyr-binding forkhead associated (FHA) protein